MLYGIPIITDDEILSTVSRPSVWASPVMTRPLAQIPRWRICEYCARPTSDEQRAACESCGAPLPVSQEQGDAYRSAYESYLRRQL